MDETSLRKIHPAIYTGTDPHTHYPSASLPDAYTDTLIKLSPEPVSFATAW